MQGTSSFQQHRNVNRFDTCFQKHAK